MEPTTNTNQNKTKAIIVIILIIILAIVAFLIIRNKNKALPVINENTKGNTLNVVTKTTVTDGESKEVTQSIDSATTFDNESLLAEIDKEF
jgi:hypothetical protein